MKEYLFGIITGIIATLGYGIYVSRKNREATALELLYLNVANGRFPPGVAGYSFDRQDHSSLVRAFRRERTEVHNTDNLDLPEVVITETLVPIGQALVRGRDVEEISLDVWALLVMQSCISGAFTHEVPVENYIIEGEVADHRILRILEPLGDDLNAVAFGIEDEDGLRLVNEDTWALRGGLEAIAQQGNDAVLRAMAEGYYDDEEDY